MNGKTKSPATLALQRRLLGLRQCMSEDRKSERAFPHNEELLHAAWQRGRRGAYLAALQITREIAP